MKYTVITGASTGIGRAMAYNFASHGHNLIINARRESLLNEIKADIEGKHKVKVEVLTADLSDSKQVEKFYEATKAFEVETFINNAGFGDFSYSWDANIPKIEQMIDLNVKALTKLSMLFVKDYQDKEATLINVASIVGYFIFGPINAYCATKFYVAAYTEGLAQNLKANGKKLRAKVIAPGKTSSDFMLNASKDAAMNGDDLTGGFNTITPEKLAEYNYELYQSDKVLGYVNDVKLELKDPAYPYSGIQ